MAIQRLIHLVSLGCPKNLTDSEAVLGILLTHGFRLTTNPKLAEIILINTCAFLTSAVNESIQTIKKYAKYKKTGHCKTLAVIGCLPKRYKVTSLQANELTGIVDIWLGCNQLKEILSVLTRYKKQDTRNKQITNYKLQITHPGATLFSHETPRLKLTLPHTAYVKIADGCDNHCSYCLIPSIRGNYNSRPINDILEEVQQLSQQGVKEIIFIAQDTTQHPKFVELLRKTCQIPSIKWIRIMYTHPKHITPELIKLMAKEKKIVKYLDLPIQHICDNILSKMGRKTPKNKLIRFIQKIRREIPGIVLRTSLIVGFPGETQKDFEELFNFVKETKFERLGVFEYSREAGTLANKMRGQVPAPIKRKRLRTLMSLQKSISEEKNKKMIGKIIEVLIEKVTPNGCLGRSYMDAPEIDGSVIITGKKINPGEIIKAKVLEALPYDLLARPVT